MYWFYNICLMIYWLVLVPVLIYRLLFEEGFYDRLKQSAGIMPQPTLQQIANSNGIWVHAASVGEIVAASPIVRELKRRFPEETVVVSVVTATGHRMARRIIPEADGHIFFPFDLPVITTRIVDIVNPKAILLVETELWPNFLRLAEKRGLPVMMVNGRISDRSARRYAWIHGFTARMLAQIKKFCMQSRLDARYIVEMGADPARVRVTGNTKYDQTYAVVTDEEKEKLRKEFGIYDNHPVIIGGSLHKGEEEILLQAFTKIRQRYPQAHLIMAPREITRGSQVEALAVKYGLTARRRTDESATGKDTDVLVLDTIGELGRIYSLADVVFVGGSFVRIGGHNILEPAAHGKPILVGPHMFNFKEIFALLHSEGAVEMCSTPSEFEKLLLELIGDESRLQRMGESALRLVNENQGATARNVDAFVELAREENIPIRGNL